jgi:hypothetical protein
MFFLGFLGGPPKQAGRRGRHVPSHGRRGRLSSRRYAKPPRTASPQWQVAYHGTCLAAAQAIVRRGFFAGPGMSLGSGVYLSTDPTLARAYGDHYIKCLVDMRRSCQWTTDLQSRFTAWCQQRGAAPDAAAKASFLLWSGKRVLVQGTVLIVLRVAVINPAAVQLRDHRIKILSVHRSSDDVRVQV